MLLAVLLAVCRGGGGGKCAFCTVCLVCTTGARLGVEVSDRDGPRKGHARGGKPCRWAPRMPIGAGLEMEKFRVNVSE